MLIKLLLQKGTTFSPQTVAEAVLVKDDGLVKTLDKLIKERKLLNNDEFTITSSEGGTLIKHTNLITASTTKTLKAIKYDSSGHITESQEFPVTVNRDGARISPQGLEFGDDFSVDTDNKIILTWNDHG